MGGVRVILLAEVKVKPEEGAERCHLYMTVTRLLVSQNFLQQAGCQCLKCVESQMPRCGCVKPISQERNLQAVTVLMAAITDCDRNCSLRV